MTQFYIRRAAFAITVAFAMGMMACTDYRVMRFREPNALRTNVFPTRPVHRPPSAFQFQVATVPRTDLDTVTVRGDEGTLMSWGEYMKVHSVLAFLVIRNDTILYEKYREGFTPGRVHNSFSVAKSITSALLGAALADGSIKSLEQPVTDFLPSLANKPAYRGVTVRNLFEMKSGLRHSQAEGNFLEAARSDEARIYYSSNTRKAVANMPRVVAPGTKWVYKDTDAELMGLVIANATGKTISQYTQEVLWHPIGAEFDASWSLDRKEGAEKTASGFNATARDFARFARLYLDTGKFNGKQIIPAEWVRASVSVDLNRREPEYSRWWQMQHSYYWWHPLQPRQGDFYADGALGQRIYVDPATRTIMVQLANDSDQEFPFRKIAAYLSGKTWDYPQSIAAILRQTATTHGADSIRPVFERLMSERAKNPVGYVVTARGLFSSGRSLAAESETLGAGIEVLRLATEYAPADTAAFSELSAAYLRAGDRVRALEAITRARAIAPQVTR